MSELLHDVWRSSQSLQLDLILSIRNKLELNRRKYPVELCKVRTRVFTIVYEWMPCLELVCIFFDFVFILKLSTFFLFSSCYSLTYLLLGQVWKIHAIQQGDRGYHIESIDLE
jgi:hypothetical protein